MGAWYNPYTGGYGRGYGGVRPVRRRRHGRVATTRGPAPTRAARRRTVRTDHAPPARPTTRAPEPTRRRGRARTSTATGARARCSAATTGRRRRTRELPAPARRTSRHPHQRRRRRRVAQRRGRRAHDRRPHAGRRRLRRPRRQRLSQERGRRLGAEQRLRRLDPAWTRQAERRRRAIGPAPGATAGTTAAGTRDRAATTRRDRPAGTRQQRADLGQHPHRGSQRLAVERRNAFRCRQLRRQSRGRRAWRRRSAALAPQAGAQRQKAKAKGKRQKAR